MVSTRSDVGDVLEALRSFRDGERGSIPLRIAPLVLVGMMIVVLAVLAATIL